MAEEGIGDSIHVRALPWDQYYHLTKAVHDRHDGVVATIFWQVHDGVNVDLLPWGLWDWQRLVQTSQLTCVGLVALTNVTVLTVPTYVIPHVWPGVPLSNHCISAVYNKMAMHIMEPVQYHQHQSPWYKQTPLVS